MKITNIHWDGSESSISIGSYGEFEVRDKVASVPDMAGAVLMYAQDGHKAGFRIVEEVIEVQSITEGAPAGAPSSGDGGLDTPSKKPRKHQN